MPITARSSSVKLESSAVNAWWAALSSRDPEAVEASLVATVRALGEKIEREPWPAKIGILVVFIVKLYVFFGGRISEFAIGVGGGDDRGSSGVVGTERTSKILGNILSVWEGDLRVSLSGERWCEEGEQGGSRLRSRLSGSMISDVSLCGRL